MRVTLVPTRAVTALVRRLAHLCSMIAWFLTRCAQPERGGREMARTPARAAVVNAGRDEPALLERTPRASTTVSKKVLHAHLSLLPAYRTPQSDEIDVSLCLGSVVFTIISNDEVGICVLL